MPFDPNALGLKCVSLFQHKANDKAVDLQLNVDCRVGTLLLGDSKRIEQIIVNFLSNGLKFTPSGGIVKLELIAREKLHNPKVIEFAISVVDTGIGIAPAQQTQLFKPFVQADAGISRKFGGTGWPVSHLRTLAFILLAKACHVITIVHCLCIVLDRAWSEHLRSACKCNGVPQNQSCQSHGARNNFYCSFVAETSAARLFAFKIWSCEVASKHEQASRCSHTVG